MSGDQGNMMRLRGVWEALKELAGSQNKKVGWDAARAGGHGYHSGIVEILIILNNYNKLIVQISKHVEMTGFSL